MTPRVSNAHAGTTTSVKQTSTARTRIATGEPDTTSVRRSGAAHDEDKTRAMSLSLMRFTGRNTRERTSRLIFAIVFLQ